MEKQIRINLGKWYLKMRFYETAITQFTRVIEKDPRDAEAFVHRAFAHFWKGNLDCAILDNSRAIDIHPDYAEAYRGRAIAYHKKSCFDEALSDYNKAIEIDPKAVSFYYDRALLYYKIGRFNEAIDDCNKALEIAPNFVDAYIDRGLAYYEKGDFDRAISDFSKAIEINPGVARAFYNRGFVSLKRGNFDQVISDSSRAIDLAPYHADSYEIRAEAYLHKGEYEKSWKDLRSFKALNGKINPEFLEKLEQESGKTESTLNFRFHPIHTKFIFQWFWYGLTILLFISALGSFVLELFAVFPSNFAPFFWALTFLAYLLSEKILERRIAAHEKAFCYFAMYWFAGLVLTNLLVREGLGVVWIPIAYFMMVFGIILTQTVYFIRRVEKSSRLIRVGVLLFGAGWGGMLIYGDQVFYMNHVNRTPSTGRAKCIISVLRERR